MLEAVNQCTDSRSLLAQGYSLTKIFKNMLKRETRWDSDYLMYIYYYQNFMKVTSNMLRVLITTFTQTRIMNSVSP